MLKGKSASISLSDTKIRGDLRFGCVMGLACNAGNSSGVCPRVQSREEGFCFAFPLVFFLAGSSDNVHCICREHEPIQNCWVLDPGDGADINSNEAVRDGFSKSILEGGSEVLSTFSHNAAISIEALLPLAFGINFGRTYMSTPCIPPPGKTDTADDCLSYFCTTASAFLK